MCTRLDEQFSMLMTCLKTEGSFDDTAVFLFSDHGDYTGDHDMVEKTQTTMEDCLTRVPLIVKLPANRDVEPGV